jgi:signal transduction histidine kinase
VGIVTRGPDGTGRLRPGGWALVLGLVGFGLTLALDLGHGEVDGFGAFSPAFQATLAAAAVMVGVVSVSKSRAEGSPGYLWLGLGVGGYGLIHAWVAAADWVAAGGLVPPLSAAQLEWAGVTAKLLVAGLLVVSTWDLIPRVSLTAARTAVGAGVLALIALSGLVGNLPVMAFFLLDAGVTALAVTAMAGVVSGVEWNRRTLKPYLGLALGALIVNQVSPVTSMPVPGMPTVSFEDLAAIGLVGALVVGGMEDLRRTFLELIAARTRLEQAYSQLVLKSAEAERSSRAGQTFLGLVSHELLTPLNAVLGYAQLLHSSLGGDPKQERYLTNIEAGGRKLQALVDDILALTAIRSGEIASTTSPLNAAELLETAADEAAPRAQVKGISFESSIEPGLILGEPRILGRAIHHMLDNAFKFTPPGASVVLSGHRLGSRYEIAVADGGEGIPPEDRERIFEQFVQLDEGRTRKFDGLGLGLPIARELVTAMGGEMCVTGRPDGGAIFTITLGLVDAGNPKVVGDGAEQATVAATILD